MSNISQTPASGPQPEENAESVEDLGSQLAQTDPLTIHPRRSSRVLCAVIGVVLLCAAAAVWWLGVRTVTGQEYDDLVWTHFHDAVPTWMAPAMSLFTATYTVPVVVGVLAIIVLAVTVVRKRWWLIGQLVVFVALWAVLPGLLKSTLPRPVLINSLASQSNSAPSGHTMIACAAGVILLCSVSRAWRAGATVIAAALAFLVALSVVDGQWHRPTDTIMALLLSMGLAFIMLAFTRKSGMDVPGTRASSASVQIVSSVMITAGVMALIYGLYVAWQIQPGLQFSAQWARSGAHVSFMVIQLGLTSCTFGLLLAMRHLTASPLSKIGLVGAPPAPPKKAA
jgi:membrane-associated phospholipid phosphatase